MTWRRYKQTYELKEITDPEPNPDGISYPTKLPENVPGKFYVTDDCLACEACQHDAPNNFRYGEHGMSYVFKQPTTFEEIRQCEEALTSCPLGAIRDDGD